MSAQTPSPKMPTSQNVKNPLSGNKGKKRKNEIADISGEDVCRVSTGQTETSRPWNVFCQFKISEKMALIMRAIFQTTIGYLLSSGHITLWILWRRPLRVSISSISLQSSRKRKLKQFYSGRVRVHFNPSIYRVLRWTFPWDIWGLVIDGLIKTEMN